MKRWKPLSVYYVTVAANMPYGCGHWEIHDKDEVEARRLAFDCIPEGRWSFMYRSLEEVHELDRHRHGTIGATSDIDGEPV
jgi:hypothetical protein